MLGGFFLGLDLLPLVASAQFGQFTVPWTFAVGAVEQANLRLKEIMKITEPTEKLYNSFQTITEVNAMMLRSQNTLRKLFEPSENVRKYLERIRQLVEELTRTKVNELPKTAKTIILQLEIEVLGYVETFDRALSEKEIEALKTELEALKSKTKK